MRTSTCTRADPPTRWKVLVDQHAQDLRLRLARHVGDFVEIERAAVGLLERADPAGRPADRFDAEQLASMLSGVIVGALRTTKGASARAEWAWMSRAVSSLPEPAGPEIKHARIGRARPAR